MRKADVCVVGFGRTPEDRPAITTQTVRVGQRGPQKPCREGWRRQGRQGWRGGVVVVVVVVVVGGGGLVGAA